MNKYTNDLRYKYSSLDMRLAIIKHDLRRLYRQVGTYNSSHHTNMLVMLDHLVKSINVHNNNNNSKEVNGYE
jgi:hypothetical protein